MKPFEKYFTMVWLDTRVSGLSSGPQDPMKYTSRDFTEDPEALRIHLGLDVNAKLMMQATVPMFM
jgi:proline iminopeptidase